MDRKRLAIILLTVLLAVTVYGGYIFTQFALGLEHLNQALSLARSISLDEGTMVVPESLTEEVSAGAANFAALRQATFPLRPLAPFTGWVPRYGPTLSRAPSLVDMAASGAEASAELLSTAKYVLAVQQGSGTKGDLLRALKDSESHLSKAAVALAKARDASEGLGDY
ncbi:MAG: hypothetical protein ABIH46_05290, partial [Chloroflexota bacterium]